MIHQRRHPPCVCPESSRSSAPTPSTWSSMCSTQVCDNPSPMHLLYPIPIIVNQSDSFLCSVGRRWSLGIWRIFFFCWIFNRSGCVHWFYIIRIIMFLALSTCKKKMLCMADMCINLGVLLLLFAYKQLCMWPNSCATYRKWFLSQEDRSHSLEQDTIQVASIFTLNSLPCCYLHTKGWRSAHKQHPYQKVMLNFF